jgi:D-glycero-alpha-D-manno-heptose 1-phosphate guanylyltransferase
VRALRCAESPLANGGVVWVKPDALRNVALDAALALSLENDLLPALFAQGQRFAALECPGHFIDIGVPADYYRAASVLPAAPALPKSNAHAHAH